MELFCLFFFLCVKVTKTFVLLSWHITVQRSDVRPTLSDVMMMYSKDQYMENLPCKVTHCTGYVSANTISCVWMAGTA